MKKGEYYYFVAFSQRGVIRVEHVEQPADCYGNYRIIGDIYACLGGEYKHYSHKDLSYVWNIQIKGKARKRQIKNYRAKCAMNMLTN